jgi:hypothetical protein
MADETPKPKGDHLFKPGQSGNPLGRPPGVKSAKSKRLSMFGQIWGRAEAPDDWFTDSLKLMKKQGMTVDELVMLRVKWCLATNTKYQNTGLLKDMTDRAEGKIPLRVLHKDGEDGYEDDLDILTDEELRAYVASMERRAALAAAKEEKEKQADPSPALTEGSPDAGEDH